MEIVKIPIEQIKVNPKNPKLHNDNAILKSVKTFGIRQPIIVRPDGVDNYQIVAGHGRLTAFSAIGQTDIPCIVWNETDENVINAYMVADNSTVIGGGWNDESLSELLQQLDADTDIDMEAFGFEVDELRALLGDDEPFDIVEDEPPEAPDIPISKRGDLWTLSNHRLLCGDATDEKDVSRLMNGKKADCVLTDPPYGMNLDTDWSSAKSRLDFAQDKHAFGGKKHNPVIGDSDDYDPNQLLKLFDYCNEIFLWGADYYAERIPDKNDGSFFVWDKRIDEQGDKMFGSCFELCWSKAKHKREIIRIKWAGIFGTEKEFDHKRHHPTQKPTALFAWFINKFTKPNNTIVDLFLGSGTAIMAAEQTGRICYGLEISETYADVCLQRYFNLTNISPIRDDGVKWTSLIKEE